MAAEDTRSPPALPAATPKKSDDLAYAYDLVYAATACSFTPSARATLTTVAKLGFPSALSASS